jgi:NRAMP (natural resistance-associated macrophage protein)-like metal ion transporter
MSKAMKLPRILRILGPGFITGASDDDPSGIATYAQTGALFGLSQLWTAAFTFPLMTTVQEMCGRIGLITGHGIAGVMKRHYSKSMLYTAVMLLVFANTINIGANLGAMAAAAALLIKIPFVFLLIVMTVIILVLEVFITYKIYARFLKYLCLSLFAYVATAFVVKVDWIAALRATLIPHISFSRDYLMNVVAVFGTTISPYLFFWQANEEVEEEISQQKLRCFGKGIPKITSKDISRLRLDTAIGMLFSNITMWFIILTAGTVLHANGFVQIASAAQAAEALRPLAGDFAFTLFAAGIIGTGFLAVPILSGSASYAISESFNWNAGLYLKLRKAHGFYGVITIATLVGLLINFLGLNPIQALYYTAILNGLIAPPLLVMILLIANDKVVMRGRVNGVAQNILGVATIIIMSVMGIALLVDLIR